MDHGELSLHRCTCIGAPESIAQETLRRKGQEDFKSQTTNQEVWLETVLVETAA